MDRRHWLQQYAPDSKTDVRAHTVRRITEYPTVRQHGAGHFVAQIPHRRVFYAPELHQQWHNMWAAYLASDRKDATVWQEFETLLDVPGFRFDHWTGGRFAEAVVALELQRDGYECFRACSLFRRKRGKLPEVYESVESRLAAVGLPMPRELGTPFVAALVD